MKRPSQISLLIILICAITSNSPAQISPEHVWLDITQPPHWFEGIPNPAMAREYGIKKMSYTAKYAWDYPASQTRGKQKYECEFDRNGNPVSIQSIVKGKGVPVNVHKVTFTYPGEGKFPIQTHTFNGDTVHPEMNLEFDKNGFPIRGEFETVFGNETHRYEYDAEGRLSKKWISNPEEPLTQLAYSYDSVGYCTLMSVYRTPSVRIQDPEKMSLHEEYFYQSNPIQGYIETFKIMTGEGEINNRTVMIKYPPGQDEKYFFERANIDTESWGIPFKQGVDYFQEHRYFHYPNGLMKQDGVFLMDWTRGDKKPKKDRQTRRRFRYEYWK